MRNSAQMKLHLTAAQFRFSFIFSENYEILVFRDFFFYVRVRTGKDRKKKCIGGNQ